MTDQQSTPAAATSAPASPPDGLGETWMMLTTRVVTAYCAGNKISLNDLPALIAAVHGVIGGLGQPAAPVDEAAKPAVSVRSSVGDTHLTCLEDGLRFKSLKRHLRVSHNLSPAEYRKKWGLGDAYPMVAPDYARYRSAQALSAGLGKKAPAKSKPDETVTVPPPVASKAPRKAGAKASPPPAKPDTKAPAAKDKPGKAAAAPAGEDKTLPPFRYPASRYSRKSS